MENEKIISQKNRKIKGKLEIEIQKCKGCEICTVECKENVLALSKDINNLGYRYAVVVNEDNCNGCVNCAIVCPDGVIKVYRTSKKKRELIAEIKNVNAPITLSIEENPTLGDLLKMDYI
jgi:2-oxoglutarate ferredoxin oxidoreductase subunit delta